MGRTQGILGRLFSPHLGDVCGPGDDDYNLALCDAQEANLETVSSTDESGRHTTTVIETGGSAPLGTTTVSQTTSGGSSITTLPPADAGSSSWIPGFASGAAQGFVTGLNQIFNPSPVKVSGSSIFGSLGATPFLIGGGILLLLILAKSKKSSGPVYVAAPAPAPASSP